MSRQFVIAGTDTSVGKTVFAAALAGALNAHYFKPVQAGLDDETDTQTVARLSGLSKAKLIPEAYRLNTPASPHYAAHCDGIVIDCRALTPPEINGDLIVEAAGGLMVPLTEHHLFIDLMAQWQLPVILCARTCLGTINHSLLSVEALKQRKIPLHGIVFIGDENGESQAVICHYAQTKSLGRLPFMQPLNQQNLKQAFAQNFDLNDF